MAQFAVKVAEPVKDGLYNEFGIECEVFDEDFGYATIEKFGVDKDEPDVLVEMSKVLEEMLDADPEDYDDIEGFTDLFSDIWPVIDGEYVELSDYDVYFYDEDGNKFYVDIEEF